MKTTHPKPQQNRLVQYGAAFVSLLMLAAAGLQVLLAVIVTPGLIFGLTALITLLLIPFVLLLTAATPALTLSPEGLTLEPMIWKRQFVPWGQVTAVKPYPLLPQAEAETTRRAVVGRNNYQAAAGVMLNVTLCFTRRQLVGRNKYQAAAGIMLVIPGLPLQYRIAGVLAGEGGQPVIAITNRTHTDYETVVDQIRAYTG